jgi:hypothetical protein
MATLTPIRPSWADPAPGDPPRWDQVSHRCAVSCGPCRDRQEELLRKSRLPSRLCPIAVVVCRYTTVDDGVLHSRAVALCDRCARSRGWKGERNAR